MKIVNDFVDINSLSHVAGSRAFWAFGLYAGLQGDVVPSLHIHLCGSRSPREKLIHDDVLRASPNLGPINDLWSLIKTDLTPDYGLVRVYANGHPHGLEGTLHHYAKPSDDELVALVYTSEEWKDAWAGETVFYDPARECISIRPRPGRLVLFDAAIPRASRAPSRDCPTLCTTISFHMRRVGR